MHFAELRHVGKNRSAFDKKRHNTLPTQIQRETIKVQHISYQKEVHKFVISVVFFFTYTVYSVSGLQAEIWLGGQTECPKCRGVMVYTMY